MKVCITGGAGFIGSHLSQYLLKKGHHVNLFDIGLQFLTNPPPEKAEQYQGSVLDTNTLRRAIQDCDVVIHLAAKLGVWKTEDEPLGCMAVNIDGTRNVLEECIKQNVDRIIFSSSSEVYGEPESTPIKEDAKLHPKSVYAVTKMAGECLMAAYSKLYNIDFNIVRFFNVYGPRQMTNFVVPAMLNRVKNTLSPKVFGKGTQTRSFCYVEDAINGIYLAMNSSIHDTVFNIGNDQEPITMFNLAEKIIETTNTPLDPVVIPMERSDRTEEREIQSRIPDISKAKKYLHYTPEIPLEEGIQKTYQWMVEH